MYRYNHKVFKAIFKKDYPLDYSWKVANFSEIIARVINVYLITYDEQAIMPPSLASLCTISSAGFPPVST